MTKLAKSSGRVGGQMSLMPRPPGASKLGAGVDCSSAGKKKPRSWCDRGNFFRKSELPWSPLFIAATSHKTLNSTSLFIQWLPRGHICIENKVG